MNNTKKGMRVDQSSKEVILSSVFDWYRLPLINKIELIVCSGLVMILEISSNHLPQLSSVSL